MCLALSLFPRPCSDVEAGFTPFQLRPPRRLLLQPSGADPNLLGDGGPHDPAPLSIIQSVRFRAAFSHLRCAATITPLEPSCMLVYGPGRYRFSDFFRLGGPLTVLMLVVLLVLVPWA